MLQIGVSEYVWMLAHDSEFRLGSFLHKGSEQGFIRGRGDP